jgi:CHAD domain-containing protein
MKRPNEALSSFVKPWQEFSGTWKKARSRGSEKSIHDLRVTTRRLIARLELARAVSNNAEISHVHKQLKKVLNRMGPLRDLQVELENLARLRVNGVLADFKRTLELRESSAIKDIRRDLKPGKRKRIDEGIRDLGKDFEHLRKAVDDIKIRRSIEQVIRLRRSEFFKTRQRFKPGNDETLHEMRIALKKLRYVVEAAQPILGDWAKESARKMHAFQQLMGNARDFEILRAHLERWAAKKGKKVAVVPALEQLAQKRERLVKTIAKSSDMLEHIFPIQHSKAALKEITRAAANHRRSMVSPAVKPEAASAANLDSEA